MAKSDAGLWLVNGKVSSDAEHRRVWDKYNRRVKAIYAKIHKMEARHSRELSVLTDALGKIHAAEPHTPRYHPSLDTN